MASHPQCLQYAAKVQSNEHSGTLSFLAEPTPRYKCIQRSCFTIAATSELGLIMPVLVKCRTCSHGLKNN